MGKLAELRKEGEIAVLIHQLEKLQEKLAPETKKDAVDIEDMDDFTRYKKLASRQVTEIRKLIAERDDCLEATAGSAGRQSVMLSAQIREQLKAVKDTHGRMQSSLHQEEKDRNKGGKPLLEANSDIIEEHSRIVELTQKHIEECEALEKRRFQTGGARGGGGRHGLVMGGSAMGGRGGAAGGSGSGGAAGTHPMKDIQRNIEVTDLDPIDEDSDVGQGLAQIKRTDQELDLGLDIVAKGMTRLKGIAMDQQQELHAQAAMIEELDEEMDKANAQLTNVNHKMKDVLDQAGGVMELLGRVCLVILLLALTAYLWSILS